MSAKTHIWSFSTVGGVKRVNLESASDLKYLDQLDQKLWTALSCPVQGLEIDPKTLTLIDGNNDGQNNVNARFIDVDNLINEGNFENAYTVNNTITPTNSFEANRQQANKIYLETYLKDDYLLAESTKDALTAIAAQTPYAGGYGVYTARVMLDYDLDENGISWRVEKPNEFFTEKVQIRVFPNPAKDMLFFETLSELENYTSIYSSFQYHGSNGYRKTFFPENGIH
jgi:hypothetical protein